MSIPLTFAGRGVILSIMKLTPKTFLYSVAAFFVALSVINIIVIYQNYTL